MEESLASVLFHFITFQRDVLDPAALGIQQVCPWRQGVDIGSRGGSNSWGHTTVVDAYRRQTLEIRGPVSQVSLATESPLINKTPLPFTSILL